jgi:DHA1 family multidrug resistance protein-like MFS transporter
MKGWKRNLYAICGAQLLTLIGFSSYGSFLPYYLQTFTSFSDTEAMNWTAGFQTAGMLAMMFAAPIWGGLADRYGRKIMLIRSTAAAMVLVFLMSLVHTPGQMLVLRVAQGIMCGTVSAAMTLVATGTPEASLGRSLGMLQMTQFVANAVGPFLGGLAADAFGYRAVFPGAAGLMALSTVTIIFLIRETRDAKAPQPARPRARLGVGTILQLVGANSLLLVGSLAGTSFANSVLNPVIPMYVKALAPDSPHLATLSGSLTSITAVSAALAAVGIGWVGDRFGQKRTLVVSMTGVALLAIPQAFVATAGQLMIWRGIHGIFMGGIMPTANALLARSAPADRRGAVLGFSSGAQAGGNALGPTVGAGVADAFGMPASFLATSAVFAVLTTLVGIFVRVTPAPNLNDAVVDGALPAPAQEEREA